MKRWAFLFAAATVFALLAPSANAGIFTRQRPSFGMWIVKKYPDGSVRKQYVYRGYDANFPIPAMYYYGYPHSGDTHGASIDNTP